MAVAKVTTNFGLELLASDKELEKIILKNIAIVLNEAFIDSALDIKKRISNLIRELIMACPEYESLINGKLRVDFGLANPSAVMAQIINQLAEEIRVEYIPLRIVGSELRGGLVVEMVKSNYSDVLALTSSAYMSNAYKIEWLNWLLTRGDSLIIVDYRVVYNKVWPSRSGGGFMMKSGKKGFAVDPNFSGTIENNFITRAFINNSATEDLITKIIEEEVTSRLS